MSYDNTNKGTLGRNKRKEKDTHPSHTGKLNVEGKEYWLSAWVKDGAGGEKFFSLSIKPKDDSQSSGSSAAPSGNSGRATANTGAFEDDQIPFLNPLRQRHWWL